MMMSHAESALLTHLNVQQCQEPQVILVTEHWVAEKTVCLLHYLECPDIAAMMPVRVPALHDTR